MDNDEIPEMAHDGMEGALWDDESDPMPIGVSTDAEVADDITAMINRR